MPTMAELYSPQPAKTYRSLGALPKPDTRLRLRPFRRTFITTTDVGYDWASGRTFVVSNGPLTGELVTIEDADHLKKWGYTHVTIHFNRHVSANLNPLEFKL